MKWIFSLVADDGDERLCQDPKGGFSQDDGGYDVAAAAAAASKVESHFGELRGREQEKMTNSNFDQDEGGGGSGSGLDPLLGVDDDPVSVEKAAEDYRLALFIASSR